jgi:hypothetical protein
VLYREGFVDHRVLLTSSFFIVRTSSPNLPTFTLLVLARPSSAPPSLEAMNSKHGDKLDSEVLSKLFNTVAEQVRMAAGMGKMAGQSNSYYQSHIYLISTCAIIVQ